MSRTTVVTGVNGFVGRHLARELHAHGHRVIGVGRDDELADELAEVVDAYLPADLTLGWPEEAAGDAVIHLAGLADVGASFESPQRYLDANSAMVTRLGEHLLATGRRPRVILASTGGVYAPNSDPIDESAPTAMTSPYVVSKIVSESQLEYYGTRGISGIVVRPFNHIGPGQGRGFLVPDLIHAATAAIADGTSLKVGNLDTRRDYTDVRDVAVAYRLLAEASSLRSARYNICSGSATSGRAILDLILAALGAEGMDVETDPSRLRPTDNPVVTGSAARITDELSWGPRIDIRQTILDTVADADIEVPPGNDR
jgi:GDP-4-dehydro-6-deoxy-D-mannose reductase